MINIRILSFDISASPGAAIIEIKSGKPYLIAVDNLETTSTHTDAQRFAIVEAWATSFLYGEKPPDAIVREKFIKGGSKRATQLVFGAWSSIDRALATYGYEISDKDEIVASAIKKEIGGKGGASKQEVSDGVIRLLGEGVRDQLYTPKGKLLDDRADAIAIGLTYAIKKGLIAE